MENEEVKTEKTVEQQLEEMTRLAQSQAQEIEAMRKIILRMTAEKYLGEK